MKLYFVFDVY